MNTVLNECFVPQPKSKVKAGNGLDEGKYRFFTSSPIQNKYLDECQYTNEALIFGTGGNASVHYCDEPFSTSTDCLVVYGKDGVNLKMIYYYLLGNMHLLQNGFKGAGLQHISKRYILNIPINLPSYEEQPEIVKTFDMVTKVESLLNNKLVWLDEIVKSRFIELFGDLVRNPMNWDEQLLGAVCTKVIRYPTFYGMEYLDTGTKVIRIGNILADGRMDPDDKNYVFVYDTVNDDFPETIIEMNDIIMAVRGDGSAAKRIGIITESGLVGANISPNLIRIKVDPDKLNPIYMFYYLTGEVGQKRLNAYVNKTAKKNIAAKDIVKVVVPVPPIDQQQVFAKFVADVDKSKLAVTKCLKKAEYLKAALMQQYFG